MLSDVLFCPGTYYGFGDQCSKPCDESNPSIDDRNEVDNCGNNSSALEV